MAKNFSKLVKLISRAKSAAEKNLEYIREDLEEIIENHNTSERRIEPVLDRLLDIMMLGVGEEEFTRLNNYYKFINPRNARFYENCYKEMAEEEPDESDRT